jgi:hypothetical protein
MAWRSGSVDSTAPRLMARTVAGKG